MCGGDLEVTGSVGTCQYCGTKQTLPRLDDDRRAALYDRANHFRRQNDFDKAAGVYETILAEDSTDAEAYWSLVLCAYGVEYVEDPKTKKRIPTCHRTLYTSVLADENYKQALEYADESQRAIYEAEASAIDAIQKGILEVSNKEEPYDVFICYKETDDSGRRTQDSALAQEIYYQLLQEKYKVFFSRITLEDKLGHEYEPYIFAALNSAKVMLVVGTKPEHFNAVWVRNEWSRFLALMKEQKGKLLIPCYRDMDPYDLPEELSLMQSQDMSKIGFIQDLTRGVKKVLETKKESQAKTVVQQTVVTDPQNEDPLIRRAFLCLEDGDRQKANEILEQALNINPENGKAYLGLLLVDLNLGKEDELVNSTTLLEGNGNYQKALRFGDGSLKETLTSYNKAIGERLENERKQAIYDKAKEEEQKEPPINATSVTLKAFAKACQTLSEEYHSLGDFLDSKERSERLIDLSAEYKNKADEKAKEEERERRVRINKTKKLLKIVTPIVGAIIVFLIVLNSVILPQIKNNKAYNSALSQIESGDVIGGYESLVALGGYKDSDEKIQEIVKQNRVENLKNAKVGDLLFLGKYEQDNNTANGKEYVGWIVLAKENGRALIISKYCLDAQAYNKVFTNITWENCTLRKWLNGEFLSSTFSEDEQKMILSSQIINAENNKYKTYAGNNTNDKVFLLSIDEAKKYFSSDSAMAASSTKYAKARGANTYGDDDSSWWWLRSPGFNSMRAAAVGSDGVDDYGRHVDLSSGDVRPALWINL